jgi:hypothetical protein
VTIEDVSGHSEALGGLENATKPENEEVIRVEPYPIHKAGGQPYAIFSSAVISLSLVGIAGFSLVSGIA